jgi:deazaflavin-dependent oxidoreductase (nitroreductase family)
LASFLLRTPVYLYRWGLGRLLGRRFLLLIHVGRRTGRRHETVLEVVEYRVPGPEIVVISGFGPNAGWLRNIEAGPNPEIMIGGDHFAASFHRLPVEEACRVMRSYEARHKLMGPVIRSVLSRLLGWPYRGSDSDRRRLAAELPFVEFRPRSSEW